MSIEPNEKEIEAVKALPAFERYQHLIKKAADCEEVYSLRKGDEWALADTAGAALFSLWPARAYAAAEATGAWEAYEATAITLEELEDKLLPLIQKEGCLFNMFGVNGQTGFVVDVEEFVRDLGEELEKYE